MICLKCNENSGNSDLCVRCRETLGNATAVVSQNKKKLLKLILINKYTKERFEKFILYTENIITNGQIILEYKKIKDNEIENRLNQRFKNLKRNLTKK